MHLIPNVTELVSRVASDTFARDVPTSGLAVLVVRAAGTAKVGSRACLGMNVSDRFLRLTKVCVDTENTASRGSQHSVSLGTICPVQHVLATRRVVALHDNLLLSTAVKDDAALAHEHRWLVVGVVMVRLEVGASRKRPDILQHAQRAIGHADVEAPRLVRLHVLVKIGRHSHIRGDPVDHPVDGVGVRSYPRRSAFAPLHQADEIHNPGVCRVVIAAVLMDGRRNAVHQILHPVRSGAVLDEQHYQGGQEERFQATAILALNSGGDVLRHSH
mmetsp:Transcript_171873/g.417931  ORF Transcript_171873/g.417931 Transcript_171873/m.417931 type:complete len:273 (-) Transcript_171873:1227-2045(-)